MEQSGDAAAPREEAPDGEGEGWINDADPANSPLGEDWVLPAYPSDTVKYVSGKVKQRDPTEWLSLEKLQWNLLVPTPVDSLTKPEAFPQLPDPSIPSMQMPAWLAAAVRPSPQENRDAAAMAARPPPQAARTAERPISAEDRAGHGPAYTRTPLPGREACRKALPTAAKMPSQRFGLLGRAWSLPAKLAPGVFAKPRPATAIEDGEVLTYTTGPPRNEADPLGHGLSSAAHHHHAAAAASPARMPAWLRAKPIFKAKETRRATPTIAIGAVGTAASAASAPTPPANPAATTAVTPSPPAWLTVEPIFKADRKRKLRKASPASQDKVLGALTGVLTDSVLPERPASTVLPSAPLPTAQ